MAKERPWAEVQHRLLRARAKCPSSQHLAVPEFPQLLDPECQSTGWGVGVGPASHWQPQPPLPSRSTTTGPWDSGAQQPAASPASIASSAEGIPQQSAPCMEQLAFCARCLAWAQAGWEQTATRSKQVQRTLPPATRFHQLLNWTFISIRSALRPGAYANLDSHGTGSQAKKGPRRAEWMPRLSSTQAHAGDR